MGDENRFNLIANCATGLEDLVYQEIVSFGGEQVSRKVAAVSWYGSMETAYRVCLWSRFASRVLLLLESVNLENEEALYTKTKEVDWHVHLNSSTTFAVSTTLGKKPLINHSHFAALRVKDGVVDFFTEKGLARPNVEKNRPDVRIHLHLQENEAALYIDLSGESLHRRGYRDATGIAPLKENLAAAIVSLSGWNQELPAETIFLDPMCGSGTLLIEAALLWGDSAPGLSRKHYGFNGWPGHDETCWSKLVEEAIQCEERKLDERWPRIIGYDSDPEVVAVARKNIERAGLSEKIKVTCRDFAHLLPPEGSGFLVSNLPYGERLSEKSHVGHLYSCVGRTLRRYFTGWQVGLFVAEPDLADKLGLHGTTSHKLYNGPIRCRLFTGEVSKDIKSTYAWKVNEGLALEEGVDFANRLRKNYKKIGGWAKKNKIECFRLYDRDLPEYNVAIDIYNKWILVQEFKPPATVDADLAKKRLSVVLYTVREFFQVGRERVFVKHRSRQKGKNQYQKSNAKPKYYEVSEGKCRFLVNFINYLDTGIFLDHRPIRQKIAELASGKRFLNLFGYTGTATVHAALGGATHTTTVDLSSTYIEWTAKNLALNGLSHQRNNLVNRDCLGWLKEQRGEFDIIFIDPPTFSNTKKKDLLFDVQKNHVELLRNSAKILKKDGWIFFSTNYRGFKLDTGLEKIFVIKNISKETIPFDFQRNASIHKCWEIRLR